MKEENKLDKILEAEFSADMLDLKTKLKVIVEEKELNRQAKIRRFILPVLAVAASLSLAIIFLPNLLDSANADIYSTYYEPYPMALNQRGDNEESLNLAIASYSAENYEVASQEFRTLFEETKDAVYLLYYGSSEQAQNKLEEALVIYDDVISLNDERVSQQAQWYKILALIKLKRKSEAQELILALDADHYKFDEAQKLK